MSRTLRGAGVSNGVAVGRVRLLHADARPIGLAPISPNQVGEEIARLRHARERARRELAELRERIRGVLGEHYAAVFEVQLLILDDAGLAAETERRIREDLVGAPWALQEAVALFMRTFEAVDQGYLRERGGDLADVHRRLQRHLRGERTGVPGLPDGPVILVARALGPSEAVALAREGVVGIATDVGGPTSHTAILAHALSIPAVVGLHDASGRVRTGETVILDGEGGTLVLEPDADEVERASRRREAWLARDSAIAARADAPVATADGTEIVLRANVELPEQLAVALRCGARGVGLYRSEFLFLTRFPDLPSEDEHFAAYRAMAEAVAPDPAVIRTLDLGGERYFREVMGREESNPVLGLRGIRFCLQRPDVFGPQLRGLLRAAAHGDVRILLPLVTTHDEIVEVRRLLAVEAETLRAEGKDCRADAPVGAMIEVPSAALIADRIADEADFLSIGTNDLIQYSLAVDRGNEAVSHLYQPLHPAVLRMIDFVVRSAGERGKSVSLCGEMAADPALTGLLVGLGLRELSLEPRAIAGVVTALASVSLARSVEVGRESLLQATAADVRKLLASARADEPA